MLKLINFWHTLWNGRSWHYHPVDRPVTTTNGIHVTSGYVWCRWNGEAWEYAEMSPSDQEEADAWYAIK